jgi:hypothetical protein
MSDSFKILKLYQIFHWQRDRGVIDNVQFNVTENIGWDSSVTVRSFDKGEGLVHVGWYRTNADWKKTSLTLKLRIIQSYQGADRREPWSQNT